MIHLHNNYLMNDQRLASFKNWPNTLNPLELAEAGFFYLNDDDKVACFSCGLCLKDWKPLDKPWIEHTKWSSNCKHISEKMDMDFINKHKQQVSVINNNADENNNLMDKTKYNIIINIPPFNNNIVVPSQQQQTQRRQPQPNNNNDNGCSDWIFYCLMFLCFVLFIISVPKLLPH